MLPSRVWEVERKELEIRRFGRWLLFVGLLMTAVLSFGLPPRYYFREYVGYPKWCNEVSDSGCYAVDVYP